jgi:hypothetical protein
MYTLAIRSGPITNNQLARLGLGAARFRTRGRPNSLG